MDRKIKVIQFGTGKMAIYTMRYVLEKGGEIVGAIDIDENIIGKDIGDLIGQKKMDIKVISNKDAEELLNKTKPDICIVETMSLLEDVKEALFLCAKLGINAITTCEEALYSWNSNPVVTNQIDDLARINKCTITGSGYQDIYWGQLVSSIAASTQKINKIKGSSSYNVEDYGIALAKAHGAGLTIEEFNKEIAAKDEISELERQKIILEGKYMPSYMWNVNGWICSKLGLNVISQSQRTVPTIAKEDIESKTLGKVVKKGEVTGMSAIVTTNTKEGIVIESECIGKIYSKEEYDKNEWTVYGEPNTMITVAKPNTVELTCASVVNRIPDVINAKPGYITTDKLGELKLKIKPLNEYIN